MMARVQSRGELGFAGLLLALGVFILVDTTTIEIPKAASNVGPRFFPYAVGALLTASALAMVVAILRGESAQPEESELVDPTQPFDAVKVVSLVGSVVAFAVLLDPAGYVVASSVCFAGIVWTLGARRPVRIAIAAVIMSLAVYIAFTRGLGIYLPAGMLDGVL